MPKLFKSLEKFVPETAMTSAWKVRSHWAGCTKQDFQWRYEAEEKLDSLGPLKRFKIFSFSIFFFTYHRTSAVEKKKILM